MKTTTEIINDCFKKCKVKDERLLKLLTESMDNNFMKLRQKIEFDSMDNSVADGYAITLGDYTIESASGCTDYYGEKEFVVSHQFRKPRGFASVKSAMKFIESHDGY